MPKFGGPRHLPSRPNAEVLFDFNIIIVGLVNDDGFEGYDSCLISPI